MCAAFVEVGNPIPDPPDPNQVEMFKEVTDD